MRNMFVNFLVVLLLRSVKSQHLSPCQNQIYCTGDLLKTVQKSRIFSDSKTFVDLKQINNPEKTLQNFNNLMRNTSNHPNKQEILHFVTKNFEEFNEFEKWIPKDYTETPKFLTRIQNKKIRKFAKSLVKIWRKLARKIKAQVHENPNQFSLIPIQNGFIIPGGRFREIYYWDTYWIIKGLLISEMYETVKGILDNFCQLVRKYGFIPNGTRKYFLDRSQPPLLTMMAHLYYQKTKDIAWLKQNIHLLAQELKFWLKNRVVLISKNGKYHKLARYGTTQPAPRPESFVEDVYTAKYRQDKEELFTDIKAGAESGWDFSSRWIFDENGGNSANLSQIRTTRVIPVDLNAFLHRSFVLMGEFHDILGINSDFWVELARNWQDAIKEVLYSTSDGIWYDYDLIGEKPRKFFYASNFAPLWTLSYPQSDSYVQKAIAYYKRLKLHRYPGGVPASLKATGEQWDFPNAWAPLQSIIVFGFEQANYTKAKSEGEKLAKKWVYSNMVSYENTGEMYEKYNAANFGVNGGGGEYQVVTGFGWSNGVALEFIEHFYTDNL